MGWFPWELRADLSLLFCMVHLPIEERMGLVRRAGGEDFCAENCAARCMSAPLFPPSSEDVREELSDEKKGKGSKRSRSEAASPQRNHT